MDKNDNSLIHKKVPLEEVITRQDNLTTEEAISERQKPVKDKLVTTVSYILREDCTTP